VADGRAGHWSVAGRRQQSQPYSIRFIEATGGRLRTTAVYDDTELELDINDVVPRGDTDVRA
jgi:hypothetical protein